MDTERCDLRYGATYVVLHSLPMHSMGVNRCIRVSIVMREAPIVAVIATAWVVGVV